MKLEDYPRPNIEELSELYDVLDDLARRVERAIRNLPRHLFDSEKEIIHFGEMSKRELSELIGVDPQVMVIAFNRALGLSDREFARLFGLENVYKLRESWDSNQEGRDIFVGAIGSLLPNQMHLETFLYTFYKMWEEHQKRHYRARFENQVRRFFRSHGYDCEKITKPTEVNGAIPSTNPRVVMQVRTGVRKDLVKRAKEFSSELEASIEAFPHARFLVIFKIPKHELKRREEIRQVIKDKRKGRRPYDAVLFQDELKDSLDKLKEWSIPKSTHLEMT